MAENVLDVNLSNVEQKLQNVNKSLDQSQKSIKDYKKEIDALKASLLQMDKDSEEYAKTLQDVTNMQNKLNEVNQATKSGYVAVDGSLTQMRKTLSDMTKDLNANYEVGTKAYSEMAKKVKEYAEKVKEAEAEQGVFFRNVGNYSNSIVDAFSKMGISVGGLNKAFAVATTGSEGFKKSLDLLKKHPFIVVATVLVGVLVKIASAIKNNEEASKKWQKAMSAFQPIVNVFNKVVGYLADKLADVALWLANKMPTAMNGFGKAIGVGIKSINYFIEAWFILPTVISKILDKVVGAVTEAFGKIAGFGGKIADFLGMDGIANGLNNIANASKNFTSGFADFELRLKSSIQGFFNSVGDKVQGAFSTLGKLQNESIKRTERQQQLEENIRQQEVEGAKSLERQNDLRDKIAKARGEERLRLQKELRKEIEENGKREMAIAKEQFALAKELSTLQPNSKEENDRLASLEANIHKVQADIDGALAAVDKKITANEDKQTAQAEKNAEKVRKKRIEEAKKYVDEYNFVIGNIKQETDAKLNENTSKKESLSANGLLSVEKQIDIENERNRIVTESVDKQIAETQRALENEKLTEEQKHKLILTYGTLQLQAMSENNKHRIELEKLYKQEINDVYEDELNDINTRQNEVIQQTTVEYAKALNQLSELYGNGDLTSNQYLKQSKELERQYQSELTNISIQGENERLDALYQHWQAYIAQFGENSELALEAHRQYEEAKTKITIDEANRQAQANEESVRKEREVAKKKADIQKQFATSTSSILGTVASAWQNELKAKVENGEISEEQAKKQFETTKALQYGQTVINTAMGVQSAIATAQELGPIAGPIMAAINSAAVLASGIAEMATIKNTSFGSTSSSVSNASGSGVMMATVNPLIDERLDSLNLQGITAENTSNNGNTRVWISQQDLEDSSQQVQIRQTNSTF